MPQGLNCCPARPGGAALELHAFLDLIIPKSRSRREYRDEGTRDFSVWLPTERLAPAELSAIFLSSTAACSGERPMTQADLLRAVARATGETVNLIDRRGFSLLPRGRLQRPRRRPRCQRTRPVPPHDLPRRSA